MRAVFTCLLLAAAATLAQMPDDFQKLSGEAAKSGHVACMSPVIEHTDE